VTRLGASSIVMTEISGPTIPCPLSQRTTRRSTNMRPGSKLSRIRLPLSLSMKQIVGATALHLRSKRLGHGTHRHARNRKATRGTRSSFPASVSSTSSARLAMPIFRSYWSYNGRAPGIHLPCRAPEPEVIAAVIRLARGNFRLLVRLLTQMERVLTINSLKTYRSMSSKLRERIW
jgi:hypothetical protein